MSLVFRFLLGVFVFPLLISSCALPVAPATEPTWLAVTAAAGQAAAETTLTRSSFFLVQLSVVIGKSVSPSPELDAGSVAEFYLTFTPSEVQLYRYSNGKEAYTTTLPWKNHTVTEMQYCLSLEKSCEPGSRWEPFQASLRQSIVVDWVGTRTYFLTAAFRDANGAAVNSVHRGYGHSSASPITLYQNKITSIINSTTPLPEQPPFLRTAVSATQKAAPITGSVLIEGGRSAAGGIAGSSITLKVQYSAASAGRVAEMRTQVVPGCREPNITSAWEPFTIEKNYTTPLVLNWVGFYIAVQYRDENGNLSQIYCDDISLEGMPARTP